MLRPHRLKQATKAGQPNARQRNPQYAGDSTTKCGDGFGTLGLPDSKSIKFFEEFAETDGASALANSAGAI